METMNFKRDYFPVSRETFFVTLQVDARQCAMKSKNLTSFANLNLDITKQCPVAESTNTSVQHLQLC